MSDKFQKWWNEHYFHTTHALYRTFKKLGALDKVDLDYIDFLCDMLRGGDQIQLLRPRFVVDKKRRSLDAFLNSQGDDYVLFLRFFATLVVGFTVEALAKRYLPDANPLNLLSPQEVKKIVSTSFLGWALWARDNQIKKTKTSDAQRRNQLEQLKSEHGHVPIVRLILDYNNPIPPKRGNKADPWGTLFLLAVTEHLRLKTGKPHCAEAGQLLGNVRTEYRRDFAKLRVRFPKANAQSVIVRINNFKKAHPL